jgi:hypothetical protein
MNEVHIMRHMARQIPVKYKIWIHFIRKETLYNSIEEAESMLKL